MMILVFAPGTGKFIHSQTDCLRSPLTQPNLDELSTGYAIQRGMYVQSVLEL